MKKSKVADFCYSYELENYLGKTDIFYDAEEIETLICPAIMVLCPDIRIYENIMEIEISNYVQKGKAYVLGNVISLSPSEYKDLKKRFRPLSNEFKNTYGNPHKGRNYS